MDITKLQRETIINDMTWWVFERLEPMENKKLLNEICDFSDIAMRKLSDEDLISMYESHIGDHTTLSPHKQINPETKIDMVEYAKKICGFVFILFMFICPAVMAGQIDDDIAVRCIIGEAADQGPIGMYALASGLINRGTTQGVYGCNAKHVDKEPEWVWRQARRAWAYAKINPLHDADHWENIKLYGKPKWAYKMREVYRYKDHVFYK